MAGTSAPTKVFGIGFHKTGTTTLSLALQRLGYRVTGPNGARDPDIADNALAMAMSLVPQYDAFQDNPWPILFREIDERVPGSKFVLTTRDPHQWVASQVGHFGMVETPMRRWIYGSEAGAPHGNEERYRERYERHVHDVRAHFADRPRDLLEIDFTREPRWDRLCSFLEHPVPRSPFPHANQASSRRWREQHPLLDRGRAALGRAARQVRGGR